MKDKTFIYFKKLFAILLTFGALAGGALAVIQLVDYFQKESVAEYKEPYIPLVYLDVVKFRGFLDENTGKKVIFDTQISFDAVVAVNLMAHEICGYDDFLDAVRKAPDKIETTDMGIMKFKEGFVNPQNTYFYNSKEDRYEYGEKSIDKVSCYDNIRIKMKDPSRLRLSFGGTGKISLPLQGTFIIEKRFYSGPSIGYTLREI